MFLNVLYDFTKIYESLYLEKTQYLLLIIKKK